MWWTTLSMGSETVLHTISRTHANAIHIRVTRTSVWTAYAWPARASPAAPLLRLVPVCENSFTGPPPAVSSAGSAHHTGTSNVSLAAALGPPRACQTFTVTAAAGGMQRRKRAADGLQHRQMAAGGGRDAPVRF